MALLVFGAYQHYSKETQVLLLSAVMDVERKAPGVELKENLADHTQQASKELDTVHNDEALKVLATYGGDVEWTDAEEKRLLRKLDWKLMPVLCATYGLQYYDKAMLPQAV